MKRFNFNAFHPMPFPFRSTALLLAVPLALSSAVALAVPQLEAADGFNLRLKSAKGDTMVLLPERNNFAHNWFAARISGLPTRVPLQLTVDMSEQDTSNKMNVGKWKGLRPFYTYADSSSYDAYTGYWRDERGQWWSRDPFLSPQQRFAGTSSVPQQKAMFPALAPLFLSANGAEWFPWQEIEDAQPGPKQTFNIKQTFYAPKASVAMRVPFTATYFDQYIARLKAANKPGVRVDEVSKTSYGQSLWCIHVDDVAGMARADRPTIVLFAREHATEHATSWSALGALERLTDRSREMDELLSKVSFLIVPLQDPGSSSISRFEGMTERWADPTDNPYLKEVVAYSRYFADFVEKGRTIDVSVSLHNVEANEAENFMIPLVQSRYRDTTVKLNRTLFGRLKEAGFTVSDPKPHAEGLLSSRLYAWIALQFGAMDIVYEVNDRDPENRLSVQGLKAMGAILAEELGAWTQSEAGQKQHSNAIKALEAREQKKQEFFAEAGKPTSEKMKDASLVMRGF